MEKKRKKNGRAGPSRATAKPRQTPRRRYWIAATVGLVVLAAALGVLLRYGGLGRLPDELTPGSAAGFNVLVVTLDTTRADRIGCYGYAEAETPILDGLAAEGIRFTDAVTTVPITLPAHSTMFTGLYPPGHGVRSNAEYHLDTEHTTLAEVLHAQGYQTAAFVSAFVVDAQFGLNQGFELYDDRLDPASGGLHIAGRIDAATGKSFLNYRERSAGAVTDAAIQWLKSRSGDRPFFAWVHYFDPHEPYNPPQPFAGRFHDRPYDGEIAYMDSQIGRLLRVLKSSGLRENTVVLALGDHGEGLGDHGERLHGDLLHEATVRVPFILSCPGLVRGPLVVDDSVVSVADIFPTVLELLGIQYPEPVDGVSLLAAGTNPDRMVYMETVQPLKNGWSPLFGLRRRLDKYVLAPRSEYYDLRSDPDELNNLYETVSGGRQEDRDILIGELQILLAKWPSIEGVAAAALTISDETRRRLESLGYVGTMPQSNPGDVLPDPKDMMPVLQAIDQSKTLSAAGRYEEALATIREAVMLSPRTRRTLQVMAILYLRLGREPEAENAFRAILETGPNALAYANLAQIAMRDGRLAEADQLLDQAMALAPDLALAHMARGDLLGLQGRVAEAIQAYRYAQELDPAQSGATAQARIARLQQLLSESPKP